MLNFKLKPTALNITLIIVLAIFLIVVFPFLLIWALNTLFPVLAIQYTFDTWLAVILVQAFFKTFISNNKDE
jgi:hypothetical protein